MGIPNRKFYYSKKTAAAADSATNSTKDYRAPTVGLEDQVVTFGKAKDAAKL